MRRIKALLKKPMKAVIERAVLPKAFEPMMPAARDFMAAAHIRAFEFGEVDEMQLDFGDESATA